MKEIFTDTSFYYFYSTVPQVLAGGIALIGAFLIFLFTELNKKMLNILRDTWNFVETHAEYSEISKFLRGNYNFDLREIDYIEKKEYNEIFEGINNYYRNRSSTFNKYYEQFKFEFNLKSDVTSKGIKAVILSGILMATSILLLPLVQGLINCLPLGILITVLVIGFSSYAIYLIANVVIRAIRKL